MATFVLVPGAWLGGWCWQGVAPALRAAGHHVYTPTLTGLGERVHLADPSVDLDTHIADVVNLVTYEDHYDVVLVGHSYAGIVVTGVADRIAERIALVAYLDSGPVPDGLSYLEFQPPDVQEHHKRLVTEHGNGWGLAMPSWEDLADVNGANLEGLDEAVRAHMRSRATPHPFGTYTRPLRLMNPAREALPKALISCSYPLADVHAMIESGHPWFRELAGPHWRFIELPTGHWPMFSRPRELSELLSTLGSPSDTHAP